MPLRLVIAAFISMLAVATIAHPARGIVAAPNGMLYFSDLERIWALGPDGHLSLLREHRGIHTHSLALTRAGDLLGEDSEYDSADNKNRESIWRISRNGRFAYLYGPTKQLDRGIGLMRDARGCTYHSDQMGLNGRPLVYRKCPDRPVERLVGSAADDRAFTPGLVNDVAGVTLLSDGTFYFRQGGAVRKLSPDGRVAVIADNLDGGNFGIAVDTKRNVYVAEYASRRVLRITPDGARSAVASSVAPWAPTGVAVRNGSLYVLEATDYRRGVESQVRVREIRGRRSRTVATVTISLP